MKIAAIDRKDARDVALIFVVWLATVLVVNPIGDFPLVDDWSFGRTVAHLLETGEYKLLTHGAMTLITNVIWGALFCLPGGFSFTTLRFSTLVAALVGLIGVYVLIRDLQQPRRIALLVVFLLGFNPLYYALSHGFMTDVLFIALLVWAGLFFNRALRTGSSTQLVVATMLALAATLSRQLALCMPVAFGAASLLQSRNSLKSTVRALVPAVACMAAYLAFYLSGLMQQYAEQLLVRSLPDIHKVIRLVVNNVFSATMHLGLSLLPVLLIAMRNLWQAHGKRVMTVAAFATSTVFFIVLARAHYGDEILLPLFNNWLVESGVGFTLLRDVFILKLDNLPSLPESFWLIVTVLGLAGAVLLITTVSIYTWELISIHRSGKSLTNNDLIATFALLTAGLYFLLLLPSPLFYDKYVIPMIPFLVIAMITLSKQPVWFASDVSPLARFVPYVLLVAFTMYAVIGTRDFLAWNRVRWMALRELMQERHVSAEDIDGGFEFNGLYLFDPAAKPSETREDVSPWWVRRDTYLIAFGPVPGYTSVKEYTYQHWLPWHVQKIVVLRKQ